jgi:hypothetical protein
VLSHAHVKVSTYFPSCHLLVKTAMLNKKLVKLTARVAVRTTEPNNFYSSLTSLVVSHDLKKNRLQSANGVRLSSLLYLGDPLKVVHWRHGFNPKPFDILGLGKLSI